MVFIFEFFILLSFNITNKSYHNMKNYYVLIFALLIALSANAQTNISATKNDTANYPYWVEMMQDPNANFKATQSAYNKYFENRTHTKGDGHKVFKRWEHFYQSRLDETGKVQAPDLVMNEYKSMLKNSAMYSPSGQWTELGPISMPSNSTGQPNGLGRINALAFHPTNNNIIWAGAPSGGLWKTTDGGSTWSSNTDNLPTLGISAILIDPSNTNTMYIGTGDRDAGDAPGLGVMKSIDGGQSWSSANTTMGNVTVNMAIQGTDETFMLDLVDAQSSRFFILIEKKISSTYQLFFAGEIATDLLEVEDFGYPYLLTLTAFDGLSALQGVDYGAQINTVQTVLTYLSNILEKLSIYDFLNNHVITTSIQWYDSKMFPGAAPAASLDPVAVSRLLNNAFMFENDFNTLVSKSCWEVLENICYLFGARCFFDQGVFYFVNWNERSHTMKYRYYTKALTATSGTVNIGISTPNRVDGAFTFLPVIRAAEITYLHKQSVYQNNLLPVQNKYEGLLNVGSIQGGSGERLIFSGTINVEMVSNVIGYSHYWEFNIRINVGSHYLTNKNGPMQWSTTSTDKYKITSDIYYLEASGYYESIPVGFTTPPIPVGGTLYFQMVFSGIKNINGSSFTPPGGYNFSYSCEAFNLRLLVEGSLDAGEITYYDENTDATSIANRVDVSLPDTYLGDGPLLYSIGRIFVYNATTSTWENAAGEWSVGGTGTEKLILELLLDEVITGQKKSIRVFRGSIFANNMSFRTQIAFGGFKYLCRSMSYDAFNARFSGEWVQQRLTEGGGSGGGIIVKPDPPTDTRGLLGQNISRITTETNKKKSAVKQFVQNDSTVADSETETELISSTGSGSNVFAADSLSVNENIRISANGRISHSGIVPDPNYFTIKIYLNAVEVASGVLAISDGITDAGFMIEINTVIRTIGATGTASQVCGRQ